MIKRWPGIIFLLLSAAPQAAEGQDAERNPFRPETTAREARPGDPPIKGVVGDGERWHFWSVDGKGRWHRRDPADAGKDAEKLMGSP